MKVTVVFVNILGESEAGGLQQFPGLAYRYCASYQVTDVVLRPRVLSSHFHCENERYMYRGDIAAAFKSLARKLEEAIGRKRPIDEALLYVSGGYKPEDTDLKINLWKAHCMQQMRFASPELLVRCVNVAGRPMRCDRNKYEPGRHHLALSGLGELLVFRHARSRTHSNARTNTRASARIHGFGSTEA